MIEKSGIYLDMSERDYRADCCPKPSLTQSMAKILIQKSPLHAWHAHPRLNPDFRPDDDTKFDVGNIAHALLIGRGKDIEVIEGADDWRKQATKDKRDAAAAEGRIAVLGKHSALADRMVKAAREQLALRGLDTLFAPDLGKGEVCVAWEEDGIWLRQLVDWLTLSADVFADYKTTDMSVAPDGLGRMMWNAGWHIQAAMGERGLDAVDPATAGRRKYLFVVQETEKPYSLTVASISEAAMTIGRKQLQYAVDLWRRCMADDRWPGYPPEIVTPEIPGFAEAQWLDRESREFDAKQARRQISAYDAVSAG